MFFDVLDEPRQILLKKMVKNLPVSDSYLAGGTALALMLGHRKSIDFDWFTPHSFDPYGVSEHLADFGGVEIAETSSGTFHGWIDGLQVTWLHYPNPLVDSFVTTDQVPDLHLASMRDIALMKWAAIAGRGSRKDFIDLFAICQEGISMKSLFLALTEKFPNANLNDYHMVKSLAYFDDAESEAPPQMLSAVDWHHVKCFFQQQEKELMDEL